uniref:Uncharacterized protein n=1 Tax=Anguilla anguilla TaxID=7936 RepID=A0A0E9WKV6_ANGAN
MRFSYSSSHQFFLLFGFMSSSTIRLDLKTFCAPG